MEGPRGAVSPPICTSTWEFSDLHMLKFLLSLGRRWATARVLREVIHLRDAGSCCPEESVSQDDSEEQKGWQQ